MKRTVRNYVIRILIMAILAAVVILIANGVRPSWSESSEQRADTEITKKNDLILWYYDEDITPYVQQLASDYFRKNGIRVGCRLVSVVSFFEEINRLNVEGGDAPDLFITDTTRLEQAYLGSVAETNAYPDIYNLRNYSVKALTSVMYDGKMVAYPLCFDMAFFVYNQSYRKEAPESFEAIAKEAESFVKDPDSEKDMTILYDVTDLLFEYPFIGDSLSLGGETGDEDSEVSCDEKKGIASLQAYLDFQNKVKIDRTTTTYDLAENSFVFGRSEMALLKCRSLAVLNREKTPYQICAMPAVNSEIPSKALSSTLCVCVNPMSGHQNDAEELAKYMTYDHAEILYGLTGCLSARRLSYKEDGFEEVYDLYDQTASFPKFLETEDLFRDVKQMFDRLAEGDEPKKVVESFKKALESQMTSRKR